MSSREKLTKQLRIIREPTDDNLEANCAVHGLIHLFPSREDEIISTAQDVSMGGGVHTALLVANLKHNGYKVEETRILPAIETTSEREISNRFHQEGQTVLRALKETAGRGGVLMRFTYTSKHQGHAEGFKAEDFTGSQDQFVARFLTLTEMLSASLTQTGARLWKIWRED